MKVRGFILGLVLCAVNFGAQANGDPVSYESMLFRSSNPSPRQVSNISVEREDLYIKLGHYTEVRVKYILKNNSDVAENIHYGFPVDYYGSGKGYGSGCYCSEISYTLGWFDDYIKNIRFSFNNNKLPHTISDEITIEKPTFTEEDFESEMTEQERKDVVDQVTISRRWFYTNFVVKPRETVTLEVDYMLRNESSRRPYPDYTLSPNLDYSFIYDMSPASNWGNGKAGEMNITVDISDAEKKVNDWSQYGVLRIYPEKPLPFKQVGDSLIYKARNFDFAKSKPLGFIYTTLNHRLSNIRASGWLVDNKNHTITASQEVEAYPLSNLTDRDMTTAWAIPLSPDRRDSIVIAFKKPVQNLYEIAILGGYHKSEKTYTENARPKAISCNVYINRKYWGKMSSNVPKHTFSDTTYQKFNNNDLYYHSTILDPKTLGREVTKIVLYIDEVFPGTKYRDLCISEILLLQNNEI